MKLIERILNSLFGRLGLLTGALLIGITFFLKVYTYERLGYKPMADPEKQLAEAQIQAKQSGRDILLIGGGDWCSWCWRLQEMLDKNPELDKKLHEAFVVQKIFWRIPGMNQAFVDQFAPLRFSPFIRLLDEDKQLLMAKPAGDFLIERRGEGYSAKRMEQFIQYWRQQKQKRLSFRREQE